MTTFIKVLGVLSFDFSGQRFNLLLKIHNREDRFKNGVGLLVAD